MKKFELFWNVLNTGLIVILLIITMLNYYAGEQWHFTAFTLIVLLLSFILSKVTVLIRGYAMFNVFPVLQKELLHDELFNVVQQNDDILSNGGKNMKYIKIVKVDYNDVCSQYIKLQVSIPEKYGDTIASMILTVRNGEKFSPYRATCLTDNDEIITCIEKK